MTRQRRHKARRPLSAASTGSKSQIHSAVRTRRSAFRIEFAVRHRLLRINRRGLARLACSVLERERVAKAEISVAIVDDAQIHAVNRDFLGHDYPTDVISFLLDGDGERGTQSARVSRGRTGKSIDGEIVISAETALRNAARYRVGPDRELALYLVHGILHLCGYDDRSPGERRLMRRREAEALAGLE